MRLSVLLPILLYLLIVGEDENIYCCEIAEAQKLIKIDCENISSLRKISKQIIGTKKINPKEIDTKH